MRFVLGVQNCGREKAKVAGRSRNIERSREGQRLAGIDRFRTGEFFQIALDQVGDAQQDPGAIRRRCFRPSRKSSFGRSHGKLDVARLAIGNERIRFAGRRFDVIEIFSAERLDELAVDEVADLNGFGRHQFSGLVQKE